MVKGRDLREATVTPGALACNINHNDQCGDDTDIGGDASENDTSPTNTSSIIHVIWFSARQLRRASVAELDFIGLSQH